METTKTNMWNVATRRAMFSLLQKLEVNGKRVGMYHTSFKEGCDRFTKAEKEQIIELLYEKMIAKGHLNREESKGSSGLGLQLSIC